MNTTSNSQPFWKDEPDSLNKPPAQFLNKTLFLFIAICWLSTALTIVGVVFVVLYELTYSWIAWGWIFVTGLTWLWSFIKRTKKRNLIQHIAHLQETAKEQVGASEIGSAIHVAGHPLLERKQPVVLAWVALKGLRIFGYETAHPVDTIPVSKLVRVETVVYDDERVPHVDVIDSAAQALQITFLQDDQEFTALFQRMKKLRPIDWYHVIQKARLGKGREHWGIGEDH